MVFERTVGGEILTFPGPLYALPYSGVIPMVFEHSAAYVPLRVMRPCHPIPNCSGPRAALDHGSLLRMPPPQRLR